MRRGAFLVIAIVSGCTTSGSRDTAATVSRSAADVATGTQPDVAVVDTPAPTTSASPSTTTELVLADGDHIPIHSIDDLLSYSTWIGRGTVEELLPGVRVGCCPGWVGTPSRINVTELLYEATPGLVPHQPIVLQAGGTAGSLTVRFRADPLHAVGTDVLWFATNDGGIGGDPSDFWLVIAAELDASGRLVGNEPAWWHGSAGLQDGTTVDEIAAAIHSAQN